MDYCSTCRRHLNGALVCPGCGAYAPDIAPDVTAPFTTDTATDTATALTTGLATGGAAGLAPDAAPAGVPGDSTTDLPADAPPPRQRPGRAARRRQLARWKKTQRRALVATAVALVGGGLTVASMDRHSTDRTQAAPAPEAPHTGTVGDSRPAQHDDPASAPSDAGRSPSAGSARHQWSAPQGTTPQDVRPDAAAPRTAQAPSAPSRAHVAPARTVRTAPLPDTAAPAADGSASAAPSSQAAQSTPSVPSGQSGRSGQSATSPSSPAAPQGSGSTASDGTAQQPPQASPTDTPTSPSHLCLLVICLS
ncbi:SCO2400 family protein [Streptomyces sp. NPDC004069]